MWLLPWRSAAGGCPMVRLQAVRGVAGHGVGGLWAPLQAEQHPARPRGRSPPARPPTRSPCPVATRPPPDPGSSDLNCRNAHASRGQAFARLALSVAGIQDRLPPRDPWGLPPAQPRHSTAAFRERHVTPTSHPLTRLPGFGPGPQSQTRCSQIALSANPNSTTLSAVGRQVADWCRWPEATP